MSISSPPQTPTQTPRKSPPQTPTQTLEQSSRWEFESPPSANPIAEERVQRIKRLCEELAELKMEGLCEETAKKWLESQGLVKGTIENIQDLVGRVDHPKMVRHSQKLDELCHNHNKYTARRLKQKIDDKREKLDKLDELKMKGLCEATAKQRLRSQNLSKKDIETIQNQLSRDLESLASKLNRLLLNLQTYSKPV